MVANLDCNDWGLKDAKTFDEALRILDGPVPDQKVISRLESPPTICCKHIFQGRCQLRNVAADAKCRCSRWE